jgi:acetylornithine deacetylase/succinyl-diaminopimelate desuccinylase-like protein
MSCLVKRYLSQNKTRMIKDLVYLCSLPTFGDDDVAFGLCENFLIEFLHGLGFKIKLLKGLKRNMIYAELEGRQDRSVLFYNHYDVVKQHYRTIVYPF